MGAALWSASSSQTSLSLFTNDFLLCWNKSVVAGPSLQRCGISADSVELWCLKKTIKKTRCQVLFSRTLGGTRGRPESTVLLLYVVALHRINAPLSALQHEFKIDVTGWVIFFKFSLPFFGNFCSFSSVQPGKVFYLKRNKMGGGKVSAAFVVFVSVILGYHLTGNSCYKKWVAKMINDNWESQLNPLWMFLITIYQTTVEHKMKPYFHDKFFILPILARPNCITP